MNRRAIGGAGEDAAAAYLRAKGYKILARNLHGGGNEIDIIASKRGILAFVEVKQRQSEAYGRPAEAVTPSKRRNIVKTAALYLQKNRLEDARVRFDIIEILPNEIRHIEDAFDATGLL